MGEARGRSRSLPWLLAALALAGWACGRAPEPVASIAPSALAERIAGGSAPLILDVRTPEEFAAGHLPGALNLPYDELAQRLSEIPAARTDEIVVHCQSGRRAGMAEAILVEAGYSKLRDLEGHFQAWQQGGYPVE